MIMKVKKTSEIVDANITRNNEGKLEAVYWTKCMNSGKGGWTACKLSNLVPLYYKTENEIHSDECLRLVKDKVQEYKKLFKIEEKDIELFKSLSKKQKKEYLKETVSTLQRKELVAMLYSLLEE